MIFFFLSPGTKEDERSGKDQRSWLATQRAISLQPSQCEHSRIKSLLKSVELEKEKTITSNYFCERKLQNNTDKLFPPWRCHGEVLANNSEKYDWITYYNNNIFN